MIFVKILSIGNSFSEDATAYLHKISEAGNCPIDISNLYIGGCSLHMHACNINSDEKNTDIVNGFEIPDGFTPDDKKIKLIKNTVHNVCSKYLK